MLFTSMSEDYSLMITIPSLTLPQQYVITPDWILKLTGGEV
jgi:hypothetical protein